MTEPQRRGFGRKVLGRLTAGALEGRATLEYRRDGVVWSLVAPWDRIVAATDQADVVQTGAIDVPG